MELPTYRIGKAMLLKFNIECMSLIEAGEQQHLART